MNNYYQRKKRFKDNFLLYSDFVTTKTDRRTIKKVLYRIAWLIWYNYIHDDLKAPLNNKAKPAFFSKPAVNFYIALNKQRTATGVRVASYSFGKGRGSIGLDPRTMKIQPVFEELLHALDIVNKEIKRHPRWLQQMKGHAFDSCAGKIYYSFQTVSSNDQLSTVCKTVSYHTDVTYNDDGTPKKDNSQMPGTPTVIMTFGDPKNLWFRRYKLHSDKNSMVLNSDILFNQKSAHLFVLDGEDEKPHYLDGCHWRHMSDMKNEANVTFSFVFRVTQMTTEIDANTRLLVNPKIGAKKLAQYNNGQHHFYTPMYRKQMQQLLTQMDDFFQRHKLWIFYS